MSKQEITQEMEEIYRIVRRHYAECDVRSVLEENEIDPDKYEKLDELVDMYEEWSSGCGYDGEWYEFIDAHI